ncbi:hypothetical protein H4R99_002853 [Coemansia sp. RSA 1722]|nr:hypothetical protein IWW45_002314 [Coemansia sp. RSA 485]KAJ2601882.1 hypothetical protein H4R99_002853 [Coemansia sp. RSA 1722]
MTNRSQSAAAKRASATSTLPNTTDHALEQQPSTPTCKERTKSSIRNALTTPQNHKRKPPVASVTSTLRRVHFSPHNEEFHTGMTPQSSPSRAQKKPASRSILKRTPKINQGSQQLSNDDGMGINGLFEGLPSSPLNSDGGAQEPVARVLFGSNSGNTTSAFPLVVATQGDEQKKHSFASGFAAIVEKLQPIKVDGDQQQMAAAARIYNDLSGAIAKYSAGFASADTHAPAKTLLQYIERELASPAISKHLMLAVTKCVGCMLHIDRVCVLVGPKAIEEILEAVLRQVNQQFGSDKAVCQTAVWCISMLRVPAASLQPAVPRLVRLCSSTLSRFETSTSAQFECLSAIEALLRRAPVATREIYHVWLFSVFLCIASPIPGIRSKADHVIRHNIPWVAADLQKPEVDAHTQQFIDQNLDRILQCTKKLIDQDEHVLVARIWGMLITVCAKHCMARINDFLHVLEQCFNAKDPGILVATLMQWRCLIYAFHIQNQLQHRKYIKLVLRPIATLLSQKDSSVEVRLACVRCWATMVYALGEHSGSLISSVIEIPTLVQNDPSVEVREIVCRIMAALLNRFVLPKTKTPVFVLPQMIIGTTNLAAEGATSLANTHGPFSSESVYTGDHTNILSRYIVGLDVASPTVPILVNAAVSFVRGSFDAQRLAEQQFVDRFNRPLASKQQDFISFGGLCVVLATTLAQLETKNGAKPPAGCRADTAQFCDIFFDNSQAADITGGICLRMRTMLFGAINTHLRQALDALPVQRNPSIRSHLTAPSFDVSSETIARFALHNNNTGRSCCFGLDMVNLVSTLHYSYMVARKPDSPASSNDLVSKTLPMLNAVFDHLSTDQKHGTNNDYHTASMVLTFMSRVIKARSGADAQISSAQEVLSAIINSLLDRLGKTVIEDPAIAWLLVAELLAIHNSLPVETHKALVKIAQRCLPALSSDTTNVWLLMYQLISALSACGRLTNMDDGFIELFVTIVGGLSISDMTSNRHETLHCFELTALMIALSARRWAEDEDDVFLDDLNVVCNAASEPISDIKQSYIRVSKLLTHAEHAVHNVEADALGGFFQLVHGLAFVLQWLCIGNSDSPNKPFDQRCSDSDITKVISMISSAQNIGDALGVCQLLLKLLRVSNSQTSHSDSDDEQQKQDVAPETYLPKQPKRSLSAMLGNDKDEFDSDHCSSSSVAAQSGVASPSESDLGSDDELSHNLSTMDSPTTKSTSASPVSLTNRDSPVAVATTGSGCAENDVSATNSTTPKRKKKKRGKRKLSVVALAQTSPSAKKQETEEEQQQQEQQILDSEPMSESKLDAVSESKTDGWLSVGDSLDWIEAEIEKRPLTVTTGKLLWIQSRIAEIQLKLCKAVEQSLQ